MLESWRYRNVVGKNKPIHNTTHVKFAEGPLAGYYEAYAYLSENITENWGRSNVIYGNSNGTGTSKNLQEAIYISISESLERWAFKDSVLSTNKNKYGFNIVPSTLGLAAYPTYFNRTPKLFSMLEARERWALNQWWEENLPHSEVNQTLLPQGYSAIEISSPWRDSHIVIVYTKTDSSNIKFYSYGFAASLSLPLAIEKALKELNRNIYTLNKYYAAPDQPIHSTLLKKKD